MEPSHDGMHLPNPGHPLGMLDGIDNPYMRTTCKYDQAFPFQVQHYRLLSYKILLLKIISPFNPTPWVNLLVIRHLFNSSCQIRSRDNWSWILNLNDLHKSQALYVFLFGRTMGHPFTLSAQSLWPSTLPLLRAR